MGQIQARASMAAWHPRLPPAPPVPHPNPALSRGDLTKRREAPQVPVTHAQARGQKTGLFREFLLGAQR